MKNLAVGRKSDLFRVFDQPVHIGLGNLLFGSADGHNTAALKTLNMVAGNSGHNGLDLHSGLGFGIKHGRFDRLNGPFNMRDHSAR